MSKRRHTKRRDQRPKKKIVDWLGPNPAVDVEPEERVSRHWPQRQGKSELEIANPVEQDTRHFCRFCKRRREERFMRIVGRGAFGKNSWCCNDDTKLCQAIRDRKLKLESL